MTAETVSGKSFQPATLLSDWLRKDIIQTPTQSHPAILLLILKNCSGPSQPGCPRKHLWFGASAPEPSLTFGSGLSPVTVTYGWAFIKLHLAGNHT